jgi:starvation-inducible DNA-binding protein
MTTKTRSSTTRTVMDGQNATNRGGRKAAASGAVPPQLATPTDLANEDVQTITQALNGLVADAFALYVKTKNFHWHLASSHFRDYHLMLDEQAAEILASIDPLAERVRRIGGTTIRSISHISQLQSIQDDNTDFLPADQMIECLINDNRQMAKSMRDARAMTDEKHDFPTSSLLEDLLDLTEKRIWFLFEISTGGQNQE